MRLGNYPSLLKLQNMIFRGPYPEVTIPEVPLTQFVLEHASEVRDKPALIEGPTGRQITYAQFVDSVRRVAAGLSQRGFKKGDVFGILSPNIPEYGIAFHAVASLGGISTTINPLYTAEEVAFQLKDSGAKYLATIPEFLEKASEAANEANIGELFVFGEGKGATPFSSLLESEGEPPHVQINPREDLVALPYSSGTTGLPKGVMLTHHNLVSNLCQMDGLDYFERDDNLIGVLPLFHIYGLVVILNMGLRMGATIVTMPRFDLEQFLQIVEKYKVTLAHLVPPIVLALTKCPEVDDYDLSTLKMIFSGAAPLGDKISAVCKERLDCSIRQGYGMTETSPVTHSTPAGKNVKLGSVGPPAPNTECKVVHPETGAELGSNEEGEICVRGPQIMKGYLNKPEATAHTIDSDKWLHTGDIGYADEDGHFFIVDRVKELIKYKGFQVAPAELEGVLLSHPAIADAAVIPLPDEEAGEVPKAFIVLKGEATAEEIMAFVEDHVAPYKKIREIEFIDKVPKSPSGKILRRVLVQAEREKRKQKGQ
jgi:acyl-CoA synthetase (AMP-forming)/AMP-acid ligase II